jgi:hypothetical protein
MAIGRANVRHCTTGAIQFMRLTKGVARKQSLATEYVPNVTLDLGFARAFGTRLDLIYAENVDAQRICYA